MTRTGALLLLSLAGCTASVPPGRLAPLVVDPDAESAVSAVVEGAVGADPHGAAADTLYAPNAILVADGDTRTRAPRLAGMQPDGEAAVTTSQVSVREGFAWAVVEYRWFSTDRNQVRVGRATMLLAPRRDSGWWIIHGHSSTAR